MNDSDHGRVVRIFVCLSKERYCHRKSKRALEQWRPTARQKRSYLHLQGEFQHNYFDFVSLHHRDHDGVVRIFVGHSEVVKRLLFRLFRLDYLDYAALYFLYQDIMRGNRTPGSRDATGCNSLGGHSLCGNETLKVDESALATAAEGKTKALTTPLPR